MSEVVMHESDDTTTQESIAAGGPSSQVDSAAVAARQRKDTRRWWIRLLVQPVLLLMCGTTLLLGLGVAQRRGWISAAAGDHLATKAASGEAQRYICPMMCTPPQSEPGRCPVCAMELVPAATGGGNGESSSLQLDPVARRVANIATAEVQSLPMVRMVRAIGEICYDEGALKTISAYADGRLDRLYADYTGIVVQQGGQLALVYSPRLYSAQVELLLAKKARESSRAATLQRVIQSSHGLYESARRRLIELGMTEPQIGQLEQAGEANSRLQLCAPISGTVIEKLAVEGQYVKEGQPIYKLADLSTVWLILKLFPEDAATIRYGQQVEAEVQSLPGRKFAGRVAFVDPAVDPRTRTVGVRVVMPNDDGLLRVGDYAKATIRVPLIASGNAPAEVYDPELADKWIGPRHPHVVESSPGTCRICGAGLVPAAQFGFAGEPVAGGEALCVPRSAVLMAGNNSVVYVESEPGRFEFRQVVLGPICGDEIVILRGVAQGEQVAARGNFLIDSQMQLAGNPSLIDPTKAEPAVEIELDDMDLPPIETPQLILAQPVPPPAEKAASDAAAEEHQERIARALAGLPAGDRALAARQQRCPVTDARLGSMGTPIKVDVNGRPVFICCEGCRMRLLATPAKYVAKLPMEPAR